MSEGTASIAFNWTSKRRTQHSAASAPQRGLATICFLPASARGGLEVAKMCHESAASPHYLYLIAVRLNGKACELAAWHTLKLACPPPYPLARLRIAQTGACPSLRLLGISAGGAWYRRLLEGPLCMHRWSCCSTLPSMSATLPLQSVQAVTKRAGTPDVGRQHECSAAAHASHGGQEQVQIMSVGKSQGG